MNERIQRFGDDGRLLGILTEPARPNGPRPPAVLLLNAGIIHRIGPHRLNVKLARHVARLGYPAMRFDLGGIGDSPPATGATLDFLAQAVVDIRAALDCITQRTGSRSVIGVGLCSGADNLYYAAQEDERLAGLVLLDPYAYQSLESRVAFYAPRALSPARWGRLAGRVTRRLLGNDGNKSADQDGEGAHERKSDGPRSAPPREVFGAGLASILSRGAAVSLIYTKNSCRQINAAGQFGRAFPEFDFGPRLTVDVLSDVDHTFTEVAAQLRLAGILERFLGDVTSANPVNEIEVASRT